MILRCLALRKATECLYTSADSLKALYYVMRNYADILSDSGKNQEAINLQRHSLQEYKETKHPFRVLILLCSFTLFPEYGAGGFRPLLYTNGG